MAQLIFPRLHSEQIIILLYKSRESIKAIQMNYSKIKVLSSPEICDKKKVLSIILFYFVFVNIHTTIGDINFIIY